MENDTYLGDGVYASFADGVIRLYTGAKYEPNAIYLYHEVYSELVKFSDKHTTKPQKEVKND